MTPPKKSAHTPALKIGDHSFPKCCLQISRTGTAVASRIVQLMYVQEAVFGTDCFQYTKSLNLASGREWRLLPLVLPSLRELTVGDNAFQFSLLCPVDYLSEKSERKRLQSPEERIVCEGGRGESA